MLEADEMDKGVGGRAWPLLFSEYRSPEEQFEKLNANLGYLSHRSTICMAPWTGYESEYPPYGLMTPARSEPSVDYASGGCSNVEQADRSNIAHDGQMLPFEMEQFDDDDRYLLLHKASSQPPFAPDPQNPERFDVAATRHYPETSTDLRYEFRPGVRECSDAFQIFTLDEDETGDYDTDEERRQIAAQRKRRMRTSTQTESSETEGRDNPRPYKRARQGVGPQERLIAIVRFATADCKRSYQEFVAKREEEIRAGADSDMRSLRPRRSATTYYDAACTTQAGFGSESVSFVGHPAGRGCVECLTTNERCSILDNEFAWPCNHCAEEGYDCIPVLPPRRKAACSHCIEVGKKQKWLICSYLYEDAHDKPCRFCAATGARRSCFAHPDITTIRQRINISEHGKPQLNQPPDLSIRRVRRSCLACLERHELCSLNDDPQHQIMACVQCEANFRICEPVTTDSKMWAMQEQSGGPGAILGRQSAIVTTHWEPIAAQDPIQVRAADSAPSLPPASATPSSEDGSDHRTIQVVEILDDSDADEQEPSDERSSLQEETEATSTRIVHTSFLERPMDQQTSRQRQAQTPSTGPSICKMFMTKFCHPITFNHDDFTHHDQPCDFCTTPGYAVFGLPETKVFAVKLPSGQGWREIRTRPARADTTNTKVCVTCTGQRLSIMLCRKHKLKRVDVRRLEDTDADQVQSTVGLSGPVWCSICCNHALYMCCAIQTGAMSFMPMHQGEGCGLHLCEHCAIDLEAHGGYLQKMLFEMRDRKSHRRPNGLRADWTLLKEGEILEQFVRGY